MLVLTVKPKKEALAASWSTSAAPSSHGLARGSHEPSASHSWLRIKNKQLANSRPLLSSLALTEKDLQFQTLDLLRGQRSSSLLDFEGILWKRCDLEDSSQHRLGGRALLHLTLVLQSSHRMQHSWSALEGHWAWGSLERHEVGSQRTWEVASRDLWCLKETRSKRRLGEGGCEFIEMKTWHSPIRVQKNQLRCKSFCSHVSHVKIALVKENKNGSRRRQRTLYFLKRNFMSSCEMKLDAILYVWIFTSQDKWCGGWVTLLISGASLARPPPYGPTAGSRRNLLSGRALLPPHGVPTIHGSKFREHNNVCRPLSPLITKISGIDCILSLPYRPGGCEFIEMKTWHSPIRVQKNQLRCKSFCSHVSHVKIALVKENNFCFFLYFGN